MRKLSCFAVLFFSVAFVISGCNINHGEKKNGETVHYSSDVLMADGLEDMAEKASYIVVGKYEELDEKINSARHPDDPKKEDPDNYQETHVYIFSINEVIKGDVSDNTIRVNKAYQFKISDPEVGDLLVQSPYYYEPNFGKKYMLFLEKIPLFNSYSGSFINYEIGFDSNNIAKLQKPDLTLREQNITIDDETITVTQEVEDIPDNISGKTFSELKKEILY